MSYRASVELVLRWERSDRVVPGLHKIREVAGYRASAKQLLYFKINNLDWGKQHQPESEHSAKAHYPRK